MKKLFFFLLSFSLLIGSDLCNLFPESIKNFRAIGKCQYANINLNNQSIKEAHRAYRNGNKEIILQLIEGPMALIQINAAINSVVSVETNDVIAKKIETQGFKSLFSYNKVDNGGNVIVVLNEKKPRVLLINYINISFDGIIKIVKNDLELNRFK